MTLRHLIAGLLVAAPAAGLAYQPKVDDVEAMPLARTAEDAVQRAIESAEAITARGPYVFAARVPLALDRDAGVWTVEGDAARWRLRVQSPGARSLVLNFEALRLPAGGELWMYDPAGRVVQGPYARAAAEGLWTAMVPGDVAVIEARVPAAQRDEAELELAAVAHGFRDAFGSSAKSGGCNRDVVCPEGDAWRDEIRATVRLQIPLPGAVGLCSGTLVNNLRQDDKPYVLTADHCRIGDEGSPASGVVTYWKFETSACGGSPDGSLSYSQSGATLRADDKTTDMTLIELDAMPAASFDPFYAGWDASGAGAQSGASVHHPSGDEKRISLFSAEVTRAQVDIGGGPIPAWRVDHWDVGTTEQGSSGSGLWNQSHRIIGTLSGGSAACTTDSEDNDASDFYARLDAAWEARPEPAGQLRAWLDPENSASRGVAGREMGAGPAQVDSGGSGTGVVSPVDAQSDREKFGGVGGALGLATLLVLGLGLVRRR